MTVYLMGKASKYKAIPIKINGIRFASKAEGARYEGLRLLERAGRIRNLELQPSYRLEVNGILIATYRADFRYEEFIKRKWVLKIEDVKGYRTPAYVLKRKLMRACHGIEIYET